MTSLYCPWWRLQLPAAKLQSRWTVDRLDTSNPLILYSHRSAWLLQASVFVQYSVHIAYLLGLVVLSLKIYIADLRIKMLFGIMLKHKRPCSFPRLSQPGQK